MKTKTWPYGTTRKATVMSIIRGHKGIQMHIVSDNTGEGHILVNGANDETAKIGSTGTLTFSQGGPTGGFWKFRKDA
jgi:hypothetical protein